MKKLLTFCVAISFVAISGAIALRSIQKERMTYSLLFANVEALAWWCPYCQSEPCKCGAGGNGGDPEELGDGGYAGSCGWVYYKPDGSGGLCACGIDKATAMQLMDQYGGSNWCCNSCYDTTYCGNGGGNCNYV